MFLSAEEQTKKEFAIHPKGPCKGVCVEVITVNKKTGQPFTKTSHDGSVKSQLIMVFQTDRRITADDGSSVPMQHWEWFNIPNSVLNEKAKLHIFLRDWEVPIQEYPTQESFENEVLGRPAYLVFTHVKSEKNGETYSNLSSCTAIEDPKEAYVAVDYSPYAQKEM